MPLPAAFLVVAQHVLQVILRHRLRILQAARAALRAYGEMI
jgi:hypothetical protein